VNEEKREVAVAYYTLFYVSRWLKAGQKEPKLHFQQCGQLSLRSAQRLCPLTGGGGGGFWN
jgi:hypothetical protein